VGSSIPVLYASHLWENLGRILFGLRFIVNLLRFVPVIQPTSGLLLSLFDLPVGLVRHLETESIKRGTLPDLGPGILGLFLPRHDGGASGAYYTHSQILEVRALGLAHCSEKLESIREKISRQARIR
jgi:hypothetical protein